MHRVEQIHLQEDLVSDTVSKERHALDECDVPHVDGLAIVGIAPVGGGEGMID